MLNISRLKKHYGPWALIAGASASMEETRGIGEAFAECLAKAGLNLVLIARNKDALNSLSNRLTEDYGIQTKTLCVDLAAEDFWVRLNPLIEDIEVGLIVYNACFSASGYFFDVSLADKQQALDVSCSRPMELTHRLGEKMKQRRNGGIIFLSSIAATYGMRGFSMYSAIKAYERMLAESLWEELKPYNIDVLAVMPGPVRTPKFYEIASSRRPFAFSASSEAVARASLEYLGKGPVKVVSPFAHGVMSLQKVLPRSATVKATNKYVAWLYGMN